MNDVPLTARPATEEDAVMLLDWRNDEATRSASRSRELVSRDAHVAWLRDTLSRDDRILLVVEADAPVGTVRWDRLDARSWELSITIAPDARGRGLAAAVLRTGEAALTDAAPKRLVAVVREENEIAQRLFESAGYHPTGPAEEGLQVLVKEVAAD